MIDDIIPDSREVLHELHFASLRIEVGHTSIEVVGTYGMTHRLVLVAEFMTVLVVILTIGNTVSDGNQSFRQFEIFLVARLSVHLCRTHIVTGADGVARQLCSVIGQEVIQEVGCFLSTVEEGRLACCPFVDDTGSDEMSEVVSLEVQSRGEGMFLVLTDLDTCCILLQGVRVDTLVAL